MKTYQLDIQSGAYSDIASINAYLAEKRGQGFADAYTDKILDHLATFDKAPFRGTSHNHLRPGLRIVGWRRTIAIAFVPDEQSGRVSILAVSYRGRNVTTLLQGR